MQSLVGLLAEGHVVKPFAGADNPSDVPTTSEKGGLSRRLRLRLGLPSFIFGNGPLKRIVDDAAAPV